MSAASAGVPISASVAIEEMSSRFFMAALEVCRKSTIGAAEGL
jgi:hypothetical protein